MSRYATGAALLVCAFMATSVQAQDALDLDLEAAPPSTLAWSGDVLAREDVFRSVTGGPEVTRTWARLRYGPTWQINDQWLLAGAIRVNESTVGNDRVVPNHDNERSRDLALDTLALTYTPTPDTRVQLGKSAFPFELSRMLWDPDLRPAGVFGSQRFDFGTDNTFQITGGGFRGEQMFGDQSRITALQLGLNLHQTATVSPEFLLTELHYTRTDALAAAGLARGNPVAGGRYTNTYRILDAQFVLHVNTAIPLRVLVDGARNLDAPDNLDQAGRMEFVVGNSNRASGMEAGLAIERIQRAAVLAAFNDDDWWFHAAMHGSMLWWGYGVTDRVRLRAGFFYEQPDGASSHTRRLMLDLQWRF
ncbi:MAG TPA: hypothetical protein VFM15_04750 [Gammaproteobacteria bacterium]|nr:hypothetical protein [Gammaproteobacteria bacterium]